MAKARKKLPKGWILRAYNRGRGVSVYEISRRFKVSYMGVRLLLQREGVFVQR